MTPDSQTFTAKLECLIPQPAIAEQEGGSILDSIKRHPLCCELENSDGTITPETLLKYDVSKASRMSIPNDLLHGCTRRSLISLSILSLMVVIQI